MQLRLLVPVFLQRSLLLVYCIALNGCHSHKADSGPSIEFTHIPPAAQCGRERVDTIFGLVRNARPRQQIVIYAHSGQWWVQPWPDPPLIDIKADSTWRTETHLGFEYAASLVEPDYHPLPQMDVDGLRFAIMKRISKARTVRFGLGCGFGRMGNEQKKIHHTDVRRLTRANLTLNPS